MIELLVATALSCGESKELLDNVKRSRVAYKDELIETIKVNTEPDCDERPELNS
jgi:hypothetical protein